MKDRVQIATLCMFLIVLRYAAAAWAAYLRPSSEGEVAWFTLGSVAFLGYVAMGALAVFLHRWAWYVCLVVLVLSMPHSLLGLLQSASGSPLRVVVSVLWLVVGGVGIWAMLVPGTRGALRPVRASDARAA